MTRSLTTVINDTMVIKSPIASPFMNRDLRKLFNIQYERTICCARSTYLQITQSRDWLPDPIGGVVWLGYDNPATTPHTPFYCGISQMPQSYMIDGREKFRRDCAWWAFRRVSQLALFRWQEMTLDIEKVWQKIEGQAFADQPKIEQEALRLFQKSPKKARKFLTKYCQDMANQAVDRYWLLGDELWSKYTNKF